jgi:exosortase A
VTPEERAKDVYAERVAAPDVAGHKPLATIGVLAALLAMTIGLFWPTTVSLVAEWRNTATLTYTHGYLIALIGAWLLLRDRIALSAVIGRPDLRAAVVVAVLSILWLIAYRAGLQLVHQVLVPVIGWFVVWAALGLAAVKRCTFALGYLYFAIPIWSAGNLLLQDATVFAVRLLLQLVGVSAYVVNNIVHIPAGVFEIAGGCSGLHFFIVAIAIAALYGELQRDSLRVRLALVMLAGSIAMLTNWLRVFTIIIAGHLTDMQHYLVRVDHYNFGWGVFALAMVCFFAIARRMPTSEQKETPAVRNAVATSTTARVRGVLATLIALSIGPVWSMAHDAAKALVAAPSAVQPLPVDPASWRGPFADRSSWQPRYPGADAQERGTYRSSAGEADAFVAVYSYQRQGREMIGFDNSLLGDSSLQPLATKRYDLAGRAVNEMELTDANGQISVLWYHYRIGSHDFSSDLLAQLYYGVTSLVSAPTSRLIAVQAACASGCESARARLADLLRTLDEHAVDAAVARN